MHICFVFLPYPMTYAELTDVAKQEQNDNTSLVLIWDLR